MKLLSICIPTLPDPKSKAHLNNLMSILTPQLTEEVQLVIDDRPRNIPTGTKRNDMYTKATGKYVCSVDCDDDVSSVYIPELIKYIKEHNTDCVTFEGWMTTNGVANSRVDWIIKLGEKYEARKDPDGITRYYRFPNILVPIKKEIATRIKFEPVWQQEDFKWAKQINDRKLLLSSVHIPLKLYHYKFLTHK